MKGRGEPEETYTTLKYLNILDIKI